MTARIVKFTPEDSKEGRIRMAAEYLEKMKQEGFESVIVHGFKDGLIYTGSSARRSALEILGALEAAKSEVWEYGK